MPPCKLSLHILVFYIFTHCFISNQQPVLESIAISCSSPANSTAPDGRVWATDMGSQMSGRSTKARSINGAVTDVPYGSARISRHEFTYTFPVKPGHKFIRLHFNPGSYKGFKNSRPFFTVKAGGYTLLTNFSAASPGSGPFTKEFCINVEASISVSFFPVQGKTGSSDNYAFVNGIEVVSMPSGLYFTPDGDHGPLVVGQKYRFYVDNSTALEMVRRVNVGGSSIPSVDDGSMFREWTGDVDHLPETGGISIKRAIPINYTFTPSYVAPKKVYHTAKFIVAENKWNIPLDVGFRYLLRLHFCELELGITEPGERVFSILMNNQVAEDSADLIRWGGKHGVALYRDYIVLMEGDRMQGKRCLNITFQQKQTGGILNGLEIFKLSNPDNNLAGTSVAEYMPSSSSSSREHNKMVSLGNKNVVANAVTLVITLLSIAAYYIRRHSETNSDSRSFRSSSHSHLCRQFSIDEIRSTTNNFDSKCMIGRGGQGQVYKGTIDRGATSVAIKRLKLESRHGDREFRTEIEMLSKVRHEHLVPLIGYCNDGHERVLVYEYMSRGTLADHLYKIGRRIANHSPIPWEHRLKISIGAAHGLYVLHTSKQRVIHRDVKSSNILLDENWVAKISDFGLSKMGAPNESISHISTNVKGTFGYLDPEYFLTKKLSRKSDVYAFGVVLFEVLSGRAAVDIRLDEEQHSLATWARYCIRKGKVDKLIDSNMRGQISPACLKVFVGVAGRCINTHPHERPAMADVVVSLELALGLQQNPTSGEPGDEEDNMNAAGSNSDRSDGVFSFEDLSISPNNATTDQNGNKEAPELEIPRKDSNSWWRDVLKLRSSSKRKGSTMLLQEGLHRFSYQEILKATSNFHSSNMIGFVGSDSIYKGHVDGIQQMVAVRRWSTRESKHWMTQELQTKMETGLPARHAHVVSLLGYCRQDAETMLIYDSMANGSLHDHLSDPNKDPLPWKRRVQICIGAAKGLSHIQSTVKPSNLSNLHRTFKSTNILLDEDLAAKVSDFEVSRRRAVNDGPVAVRGNWGLLDSDYIRDEETTEKSYVFSFGLMLFEVLCGTKGSTRWLDEGQVSLAQWIKAGLRNNLSGCIDPYLTGKISPESLSKFVEAGGKCLVDEGAHRPPMSDMVASLEAALQLQEAAEDVKGFKPSK